MRRSGHAGILLMSILLLSACVTRPCPPPADSKPHQDLWQETWHRHLTVPQHQWTEAADRWFFSGEPSASERRLSMASFNDALTVSAVRVPDFTDLRINGCFQTQIIGHQDENSLYIAGPHNATQQIPVQINHDQIYVGQTKGPACAANLRRTIVRIGVRNLRNLAIYGGGRIEAKNLSSDGLKIKFSGNSNTLLAGDLPVTDILLTGDGTLTLIGARTAHLKINAPGNGNLRIRGNIGLNDVQHTGNGTLTLMGVNSRYLTLTTAGLGTTAITGHVDLKTISAGGDSRVYITGVSSSLVRIKSTDTAEIGLSGHADTLELSLRKCSRYWGAGLHARITYVETMNGSHANVTAISSLFANAIDDSSIYFGGNPRNASQFVSGNGLILPMGNPPAWKTLSTDWVRAYK